MSAAIALVVLKYGYPLFEQELSLLFALCLPILLMDFYRVTFKFFCVVYGFLLVVHLIRVAIAQNISVARAD